MHVPFTKATLPNGLDVIIHEDHRVPLVAISVWYHVGSKNERPGLTGLAHLFEHLMFEGSAHQPRGFFAPLQEAGGSLNGSTSTDRTNYWELVPKGALRRALWMEADRMGWLLPALTRERLDTQRAVVLNERRQSYENRPYGLAQFAVMEALYPAGHPYHWPTIGHPADLEATTLDDIHSFFKRYYHPANASLAIAGDVDVSETMAIVSELFGEIPAGEKTTSLTIPAPRPTSRTLVLEDRVELSRLYISWISPALFASGDAELDLASDLIANGRTSRLYKRLIHDERVAVELAGMQMSRELGGTFQLVASAAPGRTLDELQQTIHSELTTFLGAGPSASDLERSRAEAEAAFLFRLESLGGFGGRADQLNSYNVQQGHPDGFGADLARYLSATPDGVRSTAADWLDPAKAVTLAVVPRGQIKDAPADAEPVVWAS